MFSIYMSMENQTKSFVMFGSWDKNVLKENEKLNMIKTVNSDQWSVRLGEF